MENIQKNRDLILNKIKDVHKNSSFINLKYQR